MNAIRFLTLKAKDWGGAIVRMTPDAFIRMIALDAGESLASDASRQWIPAPFTAGERKMAIDWFGMRIAIAGPILAGQLIHEMGHVFGCNIPPPDARETTFLAWEYRLALAANCFGSWCRHMISGAYGLGDLHQGADFADLKPRDRRPFLDSICADARKRRQLDRDLNPLSVRLYRPPLVRR